MGIGGIWQWVIVLAVVALLFGTKKLRNIGSDLGHAVKGFKKGMTTDEAKDAEPPLVTDEGVTAKEAESADASKTPANQPEK